MIWASIKHMSVQEPMLPLLPSLSFSSNCEEDQGIKTTAEKQANPTITHLAVQHDAVDFTGSFILHLLIQGGNSYTEIEKSIVLIKDCVHNWTGNRKALSKMFVRCSDGSYQPLFPLPSLLIRLTSKDMALHSESFERKRRTKDFKGQKNSNH